MLDEDPGEGHLDRELHDVLVGRHLLADLEEVLAVPQVAHVGGGVRERADVEQVAVEEGGVHEGLELLVRRLAHAAASNNTVRHWYVR